MVYTALTLGAVPLRSVLYKQYRTDCHAILEVSYLVVTFYDY